MFFIIAVSGCLPHVVLMLDDIDGDPIHFATREEAEAYAKENCAWAYRIIEF